MPNFKVSGEFCLEIEDVANEQEARDEAFRQLSDCARYYPMETAFNVKVEEIE